MVTGCPHVTQYGDVTLRGYGGVPGLYCKTVNVELTRRVTTDRDITIDQLNDFKHLAFE